MDDHQAPPSDVLDHSPARVGSAGRRWKAAVIAGLSAMGYVIAGYYAPDLPDQRSE
jgi:hypothetical protein